jgi:hypothetical protein
MNKSKEEIKSVEVVVLEAGKTEGYFQKYVGSPTLLDMQDLVGGYIEMLPIGDSHYMVLNEEGIIDKLPYNQLANEYLRQKSPLAADWNTIVGDVFIINKEDVE